MESNITLERFKQLISNPPSDIKSINFNYTVDGPENLHITYVDGTEADIEVEMKRLRGESQ